MKQIHKDIAEMIKKHKFGKGEDVMYDNGYDDSADDIARRLADLFELECKERDEFLRLAGVK